MNYNTYARMDYNQFRMIVQEFPEYETCLRKYVLNKYRDPNLLLHQKIISQIDYFDSLQFAPAFMSTLPADFSKKDKN